jgi:hypothetical protein
MKKCICKHSFSIGGNYNKIWYYQEGKEYYYNTSYHLQEFENSTVQTKIYHVYIADVEIPFTELKFKDKFDDRMEKREKLINQILDQPSS